jgi:hypothetical protein
MNSIRIIKSKAALSHCYIPPLIVSITNEISSWSSQIQEILLQMSSLKTSPFKSSHKFISWVCIKFTLQNKNASEVCLFLANKALCLQSDSNAETLNQNEKKKEKKKKKEK